MNTHDVSAIPQYGKMLLEHKQSLRNAQAHKGQYPKEWRPRDEIISVFLSRPWLRSNVGTDRIAILSSFLPLSYPPSTSPLCGLKKAMLKDLVLETHHRGHYLLLRTVTPAKVMNAILMIVEDEAKDCILLQLHNQELACTADSWEEGTVLIVKEPCLRTMSDGGLGIRADHLSDVILLPRFDERVPLSWQQMSTELERSSNGWRILGNNFFTKSRYQSAVECYNEALQCPSTEDEDRAARLSRALAFLKNQNFDAALNDLDHPSIASNPSEKSLLCKAQVLHHLQRFRECCEVYKVLCKDYPENSAAKSEFTQAIGRLAEQEKGKYQFKKLQVEAVKLRPPLLDHATYIGPVAVRSAGSRGRGLFTTHAVKAGDLLLCEKAFAYAFIDSKAKSGNITILLNPEIDRITIGGQAALIKLVVQKLYKSPSLMSVITDLYCGSYNTVKISHVDDTPVVDSFLVERIVSLKSFGCPPSNLELHLRVLRGKLPHEATHQEQYYSAGLWPMVSYINHSCYKNASSALIGDMMVVRAAEDLAPNTEVTCWYKSPLANESNEHPNSFQHWGFECSCIMCQDLRNTDKAIFSTRKSLLGKLNKFITPTRQPNGAKIEAILTKLANTYKQPASVVPRLSIWKPSLALAEYYAFLGQPHMVIKLTMRALESLGYVIEGAMLPRASNSPIVIKKWGLVLDELVGSWITLSRAYRSVAPDLEAQAKGFAKVIGEDETFYENYAQDPE